MSSSTMPTGENAELIDTRPGAGFGAAGFSISIDGETVAGAPAPADPRRQADIAADAAEIDIRFDGLDRRRLLNVSTTDLRAAYRAGDRDLPHLGQLPGLHRPGRGPDHRPEPARRPGVAILPGRPERRGRLGHARRRDRASSPMSCASTTRRAASTRPNRSTSPARPRLRDPRHHGPRDRGGRGRGPDAHPQHPLRGGLITASGTGAAPGGTVTVMGEPVPVDAGGRFVTSRILPAGDHVVTVDVNGRRIVRDVTIPASEWFYVGIADLTFGRRIEDQLAEADPDRETVLCRGPARRLRQGHDPARLHDHRLGRHRQRRLEDIFRRLDDKDPRKVLQRLDPEDGYPTFGDDSSAFDDAPTSGRFYLRVERDGSRFTWGDFKASSARPASGPNRALYGAELRYATPGDRGRHARARVTLYAAQPDTLPQRDILRGTGGSVYFLSPSGHQRRLRDDHGSGRRSRHRPRRREPAPHRPASTTRSTTSRAS
jgi:hypothetical protein